MSNYEIEMVGFSVASYMLYSGEYTNEYHIGQKFYDTNSVNPITVTSIINNYTRLGYYTVILSNNRDEPAKFINIHSPGSVCGRIVECGDGS
jgi:hypothetical protein